MIYHVYQVKTPNSVRRVIDVDHAAVFRELRPFVEKRFEPDGHSFIHSSADLECFGPPATEDGQFDTAKIADMGCFTQDGKDSDKYYHAAIVKSKKTGGWFTYFEWGRKGATNPQFQMVECSGEGEAQVEFAKQCHEKNDKRGQWVTMAGRRVLQAKPGKDAYLITPLNSRSWGLPDGKTIKLAEAVVATPVKPKAGAKPTRSVDTHTIKLMRDLNVATVKYARGSIVGSSLPTMPAIEFARDLLIEAEKRVLVVGDNIDAQVADKDIVAITSQLYGRIPKIKRLGAPQSEWVLSSSNIFGWRQDLDAFESALKTNVDDTEQEVDDPFNGMNIDMEYIAPDSETGKFLYKWWPGATANKHGGVGNMKILNCWKVTQHAGTAPFQQEYDAINPKSISHRPDFQPKERIDADNKKYQDKNVALMFHGTRSVNVSGILRERLKLPHQLVGVAINGAMFGPGLYWANDWKKSAGYTSLRNSYYGGGSGAVANRHAFMFAADVILGNPHLARSSHGYTSAPAGTHCVLGKGGVTGGLVNDEWIVYKGAQHQMRYLIEFSTEDASNRRW